MVNGFNIIGVDSFDIWNWHASKSIESNTLILNEFLRCVDKTNASVWKNNGYRYGDLLRLVWFKVNEFYDNFFIVRLKLINNCARYVRLKI